MKQARETVYDYSCDICGEDIKTDCQTEFKGKHLCDDCIEGIWIEMQPTYFVLTIPCLLFARCLMDFFDRRKELIKLVGGDKQ